MTDLLLVAVLVLQLVTIVLIWSKRPSPPVVPVPEAPVAPVPVPEPVDDGLVAAASAWTQAIQAAAQMGWSPGLPDGAALLRQVATHGAEATGRGLVEGLGRASRQGLSPAAVEARYILLRPLLASAGDFVAALGDGMSLDTSAPSSVGPRHRASWLVDEALATSLGHAVVGGVIQPHMVLRPALRRGNQVLLEGEVV